MEKKPTFLELIDRLEICSSINHPTRLWSSEAKSNIASEWIGKSQELENRVIQLETEIIKANNER